MNEAQPDNAVQSAPVTAGALLRQVREGAGVHIAALAASLKVPVEKLEALEADRHDFFPDVVFMRGLASSVCRHLRAEAAPVLALLPGAPAASLPQQRSLNASYKESQPKPQPTSSGKPLEPRPSKILALTVLLILVATLAVALYPVSPQTVDSSAQAADTGQPQQAAEPALAEDTTQPVAASIPAEAVSLPLSSTPLSLTSELGFADVLVLRATSQAWVQIRNAEGQTQQKTLQSGESLTATGAGPWKVVVGNVQGTEVLVRGQPMDLSHLGKVNVARFEVK